MQIINYLQCKAKKIVCDKHHGVVLPSAAYLHSILLSLCKLRDLRNLGADKRQMAALLHDVYALRGCAEDGGVFELACLLVF